MTRSALLLSFLLLAALPWVRPAGATLGGPADSVAADRGALCARKEEVTTGAGYSVHEMVLDATTVREYVSPSGIVFGVAWNGISQPDLAQLLGSYYGEYAEALQQTPKVFGQRYLKVMAGDVVVEKWGHMRSLQGRAYAPGLVPPGVSTDDIR